MKKFVLLFILFSVVACADKNPRGYENLDELYKDFPKILKSNDWEELEVYVKKIVSGKSTFKYMEEHDFSYRGLPESTSKTPF